MSPPHINQQAPGRPPRYQNHRDAAGHTKSKPEAKVIIEHDGKSDKEPAWPDFPALARALRDRAYKAGPINSKPKAHLTKYKKKSGKEPIISIPDPDSSSRLPIPLIPAPTPGIPRKPVPYKIYPLPKLGPIPGLPPNVPFPLSHSLWYPHLVQSRSPNSDDPSGYNWGTPTETWSPCSDWGEGIPQANNEALGALSEAGPFDRVPVHENNNNNNNDYYGKDHNEDYYEDDLAIMTRQQHAISKSHEKNLKFNIAKHNGALAAGVLKFYKRIYAEISALNRKKQKGTRRQQLQGRQLNCLLLTCTEEERMKITGQLRKIRNNFKRQQPSNERKTQGNGNGNNRGHKPDKRPKWTIEENKAKRRPPKKTYEMISKLGGGSHGEVWLVKDEAGRHFANKTLQENKNGSQGVQHTFIREFSMLKAAGSHKNIIQIHDVNLEEGIGVDSNLEKIIITLEYVPYDLEKVMVKRKKPFSIPEVKDIIRQVLLGLEHLHDLGILHRDIKPSNIMISTNGEVKVADFSSSRKFSLYHMTPGQVTFLYRSPELLLGETAYDGAIDMWAVGCVLVEVLTGVPLFFEKGNGISILPQLRTILSMMGVMQEDWELMRERYPTARIFSAPPPLLADEKNRLSTTLRQAGLDQTGRVFVMSLLMLNPERRITAKEALDHPWFRSDPLPSRVDLRDLRI